MQCCVKCKILCAVVDLYVKGQRKYLLNRNVLFGNCNPVSFENCYFLKILSDNNCNNDLIAVTETQIDFNHNIRRES
jgi:hypothetical protein